MYFIQVISRPKLEYASAIWDHHYACDVNKLERDVLLASVRETIDGLQVSLP